MTEREKIDAALAHLKALKVSYDSAAPPLWRLAWFAGVHVPPPHFLGFFALAVLTGLPFGILMNLAVAAFLIVIGKPVAWPIAAAGVSGAILFGLALASYYRWSARRLGLPSWSAFHPDFDAPDDSW